MKDCSKPNSRGRDALRLLLCMLIGLSPVIGAEPEARPLALKGNRFLTFVSVVRVNQIEVARDRNAGADEASLHSVAAIRALRDKLEQGFPGARMTWAFSWLALHDQRENYRAIRQQIAEYHKTRGDEVTFIPGAYFAPMYNSREQVNRDLHDGLHLVSQMVGDGYRPQSVIAGFLAAENLRYLAEQENIHVCQGTIWSQFGIDNGDGDGSICYPYYPSREHFCKAAQSAADLIDCVCLDGWTCDFLAARRPGFAGGFNSRLGLGPIETVMTFGQEMGIKEQVFTTAIHFDDGFRRNGFGWVTAIWEASLGTKTFQALAPYGNEVRRRWPGVQCITEGEFGELFRREFKDNSKLDYRFVERGSGIGGSDANLEIRWFMNRDFRLALLRDWTAPTNAAGLPPCTLEGASWIWHPDDPDWAPAETRAFRHDLVIPSGHAIRSAQAVLTADNAFTLFVNGVKAGSGKEWEKPAYLLVSQALRPGTNELRIVGRNSEPGSAGVIGKFAIELDRGRPLVLATDRSWESSKSAATSPADWKPARVRGPLGCAPWGGLGGGAPPSGRELVIDFTRYDLKAVEPGDLSRNWSLMNRLNQKGTRPQDKPVPLESLEAADQALIRERLPELFH